MTAEWFALRAENARLLVELERMRDALTEIKATHWDRRVNAICRRGLGIEDVPETVAGMRDIERVWALRKAGERR